jgi:hypothetical protein
VITRTIRPLSLEPSQDSGSGRIYFLLELAIMAEELEELAPPPEPDTDSGDDAKPKKQNTATPAGDGNAMRLVEAIVNMNLAVDPSSVEAEQLYHLIEGDRPLKLTAVQSGFKRDVGPGGCGECFRYCVFPAPARKEVQAGACEITRPDDGNIGINAEDGCKFFTPDGIALPKLKPEQEPKPSNEPKRRPKSNEDRQKSATD